MEPMFPFMKYFHALFIYIVAMIITFIFEIAANIDEDLDTEVMIRENRDSIAWDIYTMKKLVAKIESKVISSKKEYEESVKEYEEAVKVYEEAAEYYEHGKIIFGPNPTNHYAVSELARKEKEAFETRNDRNFKEFEMGKKEFQYQRYIELRDGIKKKEKDLKDWLKENNESYDNYWVFKQSEERLWWWRKDMVEGKKWLWWWGRHQCIDLNLVDDELLNIYLYRRHDPWLHVYEWRHY